MSAGFHHFIFEQGATFQKVLTLKDSAGSVVNLTGYTSAQMDLRTDADQSSAQLSLTTGNSRIALGASAGTVTLTISASDTASLTATDGVYDLEIVDANSNVFRIIEGTYTVRRGISR